MAVEMGSILVGVDNDCDDVIDGTRDLAQKLAKTHPETAITCALNYEWFATSHPGSGCSIGGSTFGGAGNTGGRSAAILVFFAAALIIIRKRRPLMKTSLMMIGLALLRVPEATAGEPPSAAATKTAVNYDYAQMRALYHDARIPVTTWRRETPKAYWEATLPADPRFQCTLAAVTPVVVAGSPVEIRFKATNISPSPVRLLPWSTPLHTFLAHDSFRVTGSGGKELNYVGPLVLRMRPDDGDYRSIASKQVVTNDIDLYLEGYKMDEPGDYRIEYAGTWTTKPPRSPAAAQRVWSATPSRSR